MPAEFKKLGVTFQYPENWQLDEDQAAGGHSVTVYSPGGAFWQIGIHPRSTDPARLANSALKAMQEEYEGVENEAVEEAVADCDLVGFNLNFFYLDLTNTALIRCLRGDRGTFSIFCQAEDREFRELERVFAAITYSFLTGLALHHHAD